jgi:putative transposase
VAAKKVRDQPLSQRQGWVVANETLSIVRQCQLVGIARSTIYTQKTTVIADDELLLLNLLDEKYTRHPFYGSRKMTIWLGEQGHIVNRKRVQRLMRVLGLVAPNTSKKHPAHKIYPYLLRGMSMVRLNQVWSTDITYIRLAHGFVYLVAIIDGYSRKVLSWQVSNTLDASFCVACLTNAIQTHGIPEIFNTDQGSQFTSELWIALLQKHSIQISMDGRGRALDNIFVERLWRSVKYEDIYLNKYRTIPELLLGLTEYFIFYNGERHHQSLGYQTPNEVYRTGVGGGASIVDYFSKKKAEKAIQMGQRQSAVTELMTS